MPHHAPRLTLRPKLIYLSSNVTRRSSRVVMHPDPSRCPASQLASPHIDSPMSLTSLSIRPPSLSPSRSPLCSALSMLLCSPCSQTAAQHNPSHARNASACLPSLCVRPPSLACRLLAAVSSYPCSPCSQSAEPSSTALSHSPAPPSLPYATIPQMCRRQTPPAHRRSVAAQDAAALLTDRLEHLQPPHAPPRAGQSLQMAQSSGEAE